MYKITNVSLYYSIFFACDWSVLRDQFQGSCASWATAWGEWEWWQIAFSRSYRPSCFDLYVFYVKQGPRRCMHLAKRCIIFYFHPQLTWLQVNKMEIICRKYSTPLYKHHSPVRETASWQAQTEPGIVPPHFQRELASLMTFRRTVPLFSR